jgi:hypothetical protein
LRNGRKQGRIRVSNQFFNSPQFLIDLRLHCRHCAAEIDEQNRPNHLQPAKSRKLPAHRLVCLRQYAQAESKAGGANLI